MLSIIISSDKFAWGTMMILLYPILYPYSQCSVALTVLNQGTNKCACFTQVVCEPVPIFYQQACWMAEQMAPNDVNSCFNKTLEGRVASLNTYKDYYAIHFLTSPSNLPSLPVIISLSNQHLDSFVLSVAFIYLFIFCMCSTCVWTCVYSLAMLSKLMNTSSAVSVSGTMKCLAAIEPSLLWVLLTFSTPERNSPLDN